MQNQQAAREVRDEAPVRARAAPLPEIVRALARLCGKRVLEGLVCVRGRSAVRQCDVEQEDLHGDGEERLDEQRGAEVCAEPVEDPVIALVKPFLGQGRWVEEVLQDTGDQHDQRDVEREACAAARLVNRVDLVCIAGDGARRNEQRRYIFDYGIEEGHVGRRLL